MPRLGWQDIEPIYAVTAFADDGRGTLTITTQPILNALLLIDHDQDAAADAGMALLTERDQLELGKQVHVQFNAPRTSLGRFALSFANLIAGPKARVEEPANYFVVDGRLTPHSQPPADLQLSYRSVLSLVALLARAAAFLDGVQQELVFFRDGRVTIPVDYDENDLTCLNADQVAKLVGLFADPVHLEQKLTILSEAVIDLVAGLPPGQRFRHVMRGVGEIVEKVVAGYRLFASSFTYSKIRREVESAQAEFITRIHKTFVDLQGQILGIPIATIVVASQLKVAKTCGIEVWTNAAVIAGAWIFVLFLLASIVNQWLTLKAIAFEFGRQQDRLVKDFGEVKGDFNKAFEQLTRRAFWHRAIFVVVGLLGVGGASFATWAATKLVEVEIYTCI